MPEAEHPVDPVDVDVDVEADGRLVVKLSSRPFELNIRASPAELLTLAEIRKAGWGQRQSLAAGSSAGSPVFWCCLDDTVTVLVGPDDETWDVAVHIPVATVDVICQQAGDLPRSEP